MAAARNRTSDRDAALRRVAIVLSSLPAPVASRLLGTVDTESKRQLRNQMSALADVDPMERRLALQAFKGSVEQHQPTPAQSTRPSSHTSTTRTGEVEDEIIISRTDHPQARSQPMSRVVSPSEPVETHTSLNSHSSADRVKEAPLSFLGEVDDETLMSLLEGEHPQTIALVLASIAPTQAALILPRLDSQLQSEALSRIGRLEDIPDEAVIDIADHLRQRIQQQTKQTNNSSGNRALNAILAAMPKAPKQPVTTKRHVKPAATTSRAPVDAIGVASAAVPAIDQLHRSTGVDAIAEQDATATIRSDNPSSQSEASDRVDSPGNANGELRVVEAPKPIDHSVFDSTDAIHQHLIDLSPSALCQALGKVETRVALLTLCGLPSEVAESVLTILPRSHSKEVRRQLRSLGTLQLREIDQAKETVAHASVPKQTPSNAADEVSGAARVPIAA